MKRIITLVVLLLGLVSFSSAAIIAPGIQHKAQKIEISQKANFHKVIVKHSKNIIPTHVNAHIGQNALIGVLLVILGALLFIPQLVTIIAATLIILGVTLFVLDIIGIL